MPALVCHDPVAVHMSTPLQTAWRFLHAVNMVPAGTVFDCDKARNASKDAGFTTWYKDSTNNDLVLVALQFADDTVAAAIIAGGHTTDGATRVDPVTRVFTHAAVGGNTVTHMPTVEHPSFVRVPCKGLPSIGVGNEILWFKANGDFGSVFRSVAQTDKLRVHAPTTAGCPQHGNNHTKLWVRVTAQRYSPAPPDANFDGFKEIPTDHKPAIDDVLQRYLIDTQQKRLVISLVGAPGVGKSTLGSHLFSLLTRQPLEVGAAFGAGRDLLETAGQYSLQVNERLLTTPAKATLLLRDVVDYTNTVAIYERQHAGEPVPQAVVDGQRKIDEESWWPKLVIDNRTRVEAHELASVVVLVVPAQEVYDYNPKAQTRQSTT
jgi:hypothetical protein